MINDHVFCYQCGQSTIKSKSYKCKGCGKIYCYCCVPDLVIIDRCECGCKLIRISEITSEE